MNFDRLFAMPLFTYKSCPGACGLQLVPDLATDLGTVSSDATTWTFRIQSDVKFENGTVVTAQDVKYAIERTYDRSVLGNGPSYFQVLLTDPDYPGPYKDKSATGLTAIDTPDATTLVFHLQFPFRTCRTCWRSVKPPPCCPARIRAAATSCTRCPRVRICSRATHRASSSS